MKRVRGKLAGPLTHTALAQYKHLGANTSLQRIVFRLNISTALITIIQP